MNIFEKDAAYVANTYGRFPVQLVKGQNATAWDADGKKYIDVGSGIAVNTFGFADEALVKAVTEQMMTLQHTSNLYYTEPCVKLAEMICKATDMKKVFFGNKLF